MPDTSNASSFLRRPDSHWVVIIAAISLFSDPNAVGDAIPYQFVGDGQNWALIALLFLLYHHSTLKNDALSATYSTPGFAVVAGFFLLGGRSVVPVALLNPSHYQSLLLALGTYYSSPATESGYVPGITELVLIPATWLIASSLRTTEALSEPYLQWILLAALALIGVIFSTMNVTGPLRYGYRNYLNLYISYRSRIPSWTHFPLLWLAFHPWTGWWLLGGSVGVAWQYVREHHREASTKIIDDVEKAKIRASSLSAWAKDEAAAAERCELQVHKLATSVTRDARSAHYVGIADFYTESAAGMAPQGKMNHTAAASDTSSIAVSVTLYALDATKAARAARDAADTVHKLAIDSKSLAAIGDLEAAQHTVNKLQDALKDCEGKHNDAVRARENAQQKMAGFHGEIIATSSGSNQQGSEQLQDQQKRDPEDQEKLDSTAMLDDDEESNF
ncbi:uncharacterized protein TRIVIDRAFT_230747 [Trichoderma virens Gv29-8]|uniref:Uncharacterized protein n=1 Tax=Hypocrea virens (strain Gv29-8 / FGSC 10586) TaxID=413071 RepID=G9MTZ0_HYPVG|nr:uncharacterized protein TRIVIDRAFT_230747 [Trichoderma virens Gv29-8]EHK22090.1 hypothetical protein TRIVIDRAFT_230747 [Trichoderma virens Gv29-8]